jgi:hypothetical protein
MGVLPGGRELGSPEHRIQLSPVIQAGSIASMRAQNRMLWATRLELGLIVLAAVGGMMWGWAGTPFAAALSIVGFAGALVASGYIARARPERDWYDGRAAAESCKTLAWRYAVGGRPFGIGPGTQRKADEAFVAAIRDVISSLSYVSSAEDAGPQITDDMRATRALPLQERRSVYERGRIADQQGWYAAKAAYNARRADRWRRAILALEFVGLTAGVAAVAGSIAVDFLGVVAAATAAVSAWLQIKQHETLARAYSVTAEELSAIRSLVPHQASERDWADFVDQSEEAVSREHTLWRASRGVTAPTGLPLRYTGKPS